MITEPNVSLSLNSSHCSHTTPLDPSSEDLGLVTYQI